MFRHLLISFLALFSDSLTEVDRSFLPHTQLEYNSRVTTKDCGLRYDRPDDICLADAAPNGIHDGTLMPENQSRDNKFNTVLGEYPFMAAIHGCGAVLINTIWALTAAHCSYGFNDYFNYKINIIIHIIFDSNNNFDSDVIRIGLVSTSENTEQEYYREIEIEKFVVRRNLTNTAKLSDRAFDIALVKLKTAFNNAIVGHNYIINSICLPMKNIINKHTEMCVSLGWSSQHTDNNVFLSKALLKIISKNNCDQLVRKTINGMTQTDGIICVKGVTTDICESGYGGTIVQYVNGRAIVIGIAMSVRHEQKETFCESGIAYFVRVSKHIDWIMNTISKN